MYIFRKTQYSKSLYCAYNNNLFKANYLHKKIKTQKENKKGLYSFFKYFNLKNRRLSS